MPGLAWPLLDQLLSPTKERSGVPPAMASLPSTWNFPSNHHRGVMTKDELRAELERQAQRFFATAGGEIVLYAAQRKPDRQPWRKKPSLLDEAFQAEIRKIEHQHDTKA